MYLLSLKIVLIGGPKLSQTKHVFSPLECQHYPIFELIFEVFWMPKRAESQNGGTVKFIVLLK